MDWFLCDNGLRHEMVKRHFEINLSQAYDYKQNEKRCIMESCESQI